MWIEARDVFPGHRSHIMEPVLDLVDDIEFIIEQSYAALRA
jgi:hypothetical protein